MKPIKTFEDGSEVTMPVLLTAVVVGAIFGVAAVTIKSRYDRWVVKQYMRKNSPTRRIHGLY